MKIGIVSLSIKTTPPAKGVICAPNLIIANLAKGLKAEGHEPVVFTGTDSKIDCKKITADLKTAWGQYGPDDQDPVSFTQRKVEYDLILVNEAIKCYKNGEIDLIHCHDVRTSPYVFMNSTVPVMYTPHYDIESNLTPYDIHRYAQIKLNKNICFANISMKNIKTCKKLGLNNIAYVPNGIDVNLFKFNETNRDGILLVSRIIEGKKVKEIIEIACSIKQSITLIGASGPTKQDKNYFSELEKKYFSKKNVNYLGYQPPEKIVQYFQKAKVLVYPSVSEGMPLGILEALSTGLPVVASNVGGVPDIIEDGVNGYLIDGFNLADWKEKIRLAENIKPKECRRKIVENHSIEKMTKNYISAYEKFLKVKNV